MNSKTILAPFLAAASALCLMAQPLSAGLFGLFTYTDNGTSITITGYPDDAVGAVVIPDTISEKPVTAIGYEAFNWCIGLTSVSIPNSVTSIGDYAFDLCNGLTSAVFLATLLQWETVCLIMPPAVSRCIINREAAVSPPRFGLVTLL